MKVAKLVLLLILSGVALMLYGREPSFGDIKVKLSFEHAPTYRTRTGGVINGSSLFDNEQYLAVEAIYNPGVVTENVVNRKGKQISSPQAASNAWLDGVEMKVLVAYPEVTGRTRKETVYGLFSGKTTFWSIRLDGKKHTATMFVPPQLLARYTNIRARSPRKSDGKIPRSSYRLSTRDFFVEVIFTTRDGKELGRGYCHVDAARTVNEKDAVFRHLESRLGSRIVEGAVLSRDLSPWALINPERYDFISPPGGTKK